MIDPPLTPEEIASYERNPLTGPQDDRVLPLEKYGLNGELTPFFVHQAKDRVNHVYIAGPMTGIEEYNFPAFHAAADELRGAGYTVHNPADHGLVPGAQRDDYLRYDFRELLLCEYIYFLPDWQKSLGAREEYNLANRFGIKMLFHPGAQDLTWTAPIIE